MIHYQDRLFIVGMTDSGKSTLAAQVFASTAPPRFIVDPADASLTARLADHTVHGEGPDQVDRLLTVHADVDTVRYVPADPSDSAEYDAVYTWLFDHFPRFVWLDEAGIAAPSRGCPPMITRLLVQGRKRQLGHLACHTRPREVSRNLIALSHHVAFFRLPNPDDRDHVARQVGITPATLTEHMNQLDEHGFLWWDVRARELTVCPPLDLEDVA